MACITTMQRYEIKYLLGAREKEAVLQAMSPYMELDEYGRTTIRNVYFDTDSFRLIRRSLEKPAYKEKLRIRSYQPARPDDPVFVEGGAARTGSPPELSGEHPSAASVPDRR